MLGSRKTQKRHKGTKIDRVRKSVRAREYFRRVAEESERVKESHQVSENHGEREKELKIISERNKC